MVRDDTWFERLYECHHRAVTAYCRRRLAAADAPDAVAEVFAVAWRRRDVVPDGARALPWLYGVARRVVSHQWRGTHRARRLVERVGTQRPSAPPAPDAVVQDSVEHRRVREAVSQLGETDREVLLLSAWEGLTHAEIAEAMGCSRAAVDKRVIRARARLAERYEALAAAATPGAHERTEISRRASTKEVRTRGS